MAIHQKYHQSDFELLVWKIEETLKFFEKELALSSEQCEQLQGNFKNQEALLQWLASRCGLQLLFDRPFDDFKKNEQGKLELLDQSARLSISHSDQFIAVVKAPQAVGVDIQAPTPKLQRIASKYIDASLLEQLKQTEHYDDYLHIYWGIKEALFKAYGLGKVNFIEHLHIAPFEFTAQGQTTAQLIKPNFKASYQVFYEKTEDYYLCVVTNS